MNLYLDGYPFLYQSRSVGCSMAAMIFKPTPRSRSRLVTAIFAMSLLFAFPLASLNVAAQSKGKKVESNPAPAAKDRERLRQAIAAVGQIRVMSEGRGPFERGSGVIVRKDGIIATNYHVINNERTGKVFEQILFDLAVASAASTLRRFRLEPVLLSKEYDLALLVIAADGAGNPLSGAAAFSAIELGDSRKVELLDELVIIGFPAKGLSGVTVNTGMVEGADALGNWIKTNARIIHGNSGGAAVNSEGKLIGIPTKVLVDKKVVDEDGDGFPDTEREYGAVGFLRPAHFVAEMLRQIDPPGAMARRKSFSSTAASPAKEDERAMTITKPKTAAPQDSATVRGVVTSLASGSPVAGARVGLVRVGTKEITAESLLTWGGTNNEGQFQLNNAVPPGLYTLKVKALGYEMLSLDVEVTREGQPIVVQLRPAS